MKARSARKLWSITGMEFRLTAANKAFVVITILGPFLIVALSVLPSLLSMRGTDSGERSIAVVGGEPEMVKQMAAALEPSRIRVSPAADEQAALDTKVLAGELAGYLVIPTDLLTAERVSYVTSSSGDWQTLGVLQGFIGRWVLAQRLSRAGVDPATLPSFMVEPTVEASRLTKEGEKEQQDFMSALLTGLSFTFLLYMTVLLYGQSIGTSVVREKTSKTVEIMLSSVNPRQLLVGKILGRAAAGLLQYAIWIVMAVVVLQLLGPVVKVAIPIAGGLRIVLYLVLFFLIAFFMYSSAYAALGAASEDEQHMGQLSWPLIAFLVIPMLFIGGIIQAPDGTVSTVLSIFPLTAPIVMFQRVVLGNPPTWQVVTSIGVSILTTALIAVLSARIFRIGILMTGKRYRVGEVLRWLSYR